jgi:hypothetical protein
MLRGRDPRRLSVPFIGKPAEVWWTRGRPVVWRRLTRLYLSQLTRGRRWCSVIHLSATLIIYLWACIHFLNLHICVLLVLISIFLAIIIIVTLLIYLVLVLTRAAVPFTMVLVIIFILQSPRFWGWLSPAISAELSACSMSGTAGSSSSTEISPSSSSSSSSSDCHSLSNITGAPLERCCAAWSGSIAV